VRGPALGILDRMGLLQAAENKKTNIRGASFVDRDGNELSRDTEATPTGSPLTLWRPTGPRLREGAGFGTFGDGQKPR
jgi:hypothetical protein